MNFLELKGPPELLVILYCQITIAVGGPAHGFAGSS